jgi:hypothetical protein
MSKALNEFLRGVCKSFEDAAFSTHSRPSFPAANQNFGDLVSNVSGISTLNLSDSRAPAQDYLDAPASHTKTTAKKTRAAKAAKKPDGEIREI